MKKLIHLTAVVLSSYTAAAQCGMTTMISVSASCSFGAASVNTTGGMGPYTIVVELHFFQGSWTTVETVLGDQDGDWSNSSFGFWLDRRDQARVTVTDAMGCTATHTTQPWQPLYQQMGYIQTYVDCTTGVSTIEFRPLDMGMTGPSTWTYWLDQGPVTPFLQNWTLVPGSDPVRYRYNTSLSAGPHTFGTPNTTSATYVYCGVYLQVTTGGPISPGDCGVNVRIKALLDGALPTGTVMTDGLRVAGLIPTQEPYSGLGYTFVGSPPNVSIPPSMLAVTGNDAVEDWVVVEVRASAAPYAVLFSKPALLQRDGDVIDTDGDPYIACPLPAGAYRVALRHRNHLGVMTGTGTSYSVDPLFVCDFRSGATPTHGTNAQVQKPSSFWCLWAGDATGDGVLKYSGLNNDRDPILIAIGGGTPNNSLSNQYSRLDTNLDGVVKYTGLNNDRDIILTNVGSTTPNNTRTQQLP